MISKFYGEEYKHSKAQKRRQSSIGNARRLVYDSPQSLVQRDCISILSGRVGTV